MNRRAVPKIGMISYGEDRLREEGFVVLPLERSFALDPQRLRPHYHDFFQVSLLLGKVGLMHDFRETETEGTTLFFLSPGQVHTIAPRARMKGTIVSFTREFLEEGGGDGFLLDLPFYHTADRAPWLRLHGRGVGWTKEVFRQLQEEYDQEEAGSAEVVRSWLKILFVRSARWHAVESPVVEGSRQALLAKRFQQAIEAGSYRQTVGDFAKELGVTANYLNDVVRKETGQAAGEHLRRRRLLDAKRSLLHSTLSVSEIGYSLGFEDPSYFSRFFRRYEGVTPGEFRKKIREKYQKGAG